ncbi:hypothetical protein FRACYDRAFT_238299 [Fragilariopsis cylindrus CCMP1102]|uniref:Uncharacterized protein n=1 Tax=Fragilariopsis cylindrus CCMP1102 TaxID=635003 RepID=A0A1E7FI70_9STRA|nr:hypothetical protein FRACYDRAFT_238299 [Fragilariopsis cylindrus CCMP1102]|eukprot:OEU17871.1 hypothetical protein FRACYDRAFT_238299 [Fragilariopsis cylindrus CCMP1102]
MNQSSSSLPRRVQRQRKQQQQQEQLELEQQQQLEQQHQQQLEQQQQQPQPQRKQQQRQRQPASQQQLEQHQQQQLEQQQLEQQPQQQQLEQQLEQQQQPRQPASQQLEQQQQQQQQQQQHVVVPFEFITSPTTGSTIHPLVYCFHVEERVRTLEKFIQQELQPKVLRLQDENDWIDQRTSSTSSSNSSSSSSKLNKLKYKQIQIQRLKHQAWLHKKTIKRNELHQIQSTFELALDIYKISNIFNPNILLLTVLWQRNQETQSIKNPTSTSTTTPTAGDYDDNDYMSSIKKDKDNSRRHRSNNRNRNTKNETDPHLQLLSREYHYAYTENLRLSKSIQERLVGMKMKVKTSTTTVKTRDNGKTCSKVSAASSSSTNDAAATSASPPPYATIVSSLIEYCKDFCICNTCKGMFHNDYYKALIIRNNDVPKKEEEEQEESTITYSCSHCWNSNDARETQKRQKLPPHTAFQQQQQQWQQQQQQQQREQQQRQQVEKQDTLSSSTTTPTPTPTTVMIPEKISSPIEEEKKRKLTIKNNNSNNKENIQLQLQPTTNTIKADNTTITTTTITTTRGMNSKNTTSMSKNALFMGARYRIRQPTNSPLPPVSTTTSIVPNATPITRSRNDSWSSCSSLKLIGTNPIVESEHQRDMSLRSSFRSTCASVIDNVVDDHNGDNNKSSKKSGRTNTNTTTVIFGSSTSSICSNSIAECNSIEESYLRPPLGATSARLKAKANDGDGRKSSQIIREEKASSSKRGDSWTRFGSSSSSICSTSIIAEYRATEGYHELPPSGPTTTTPSSSTRRSKWKTIDDDEDNNKSSQIKKEKSNSSRKKGDSWSRFGSSESSICTTPSVAESESMHSTRYISGIMKKKSKTSSKSSSSSRLSPIKVEHFPLPKKVRFQLPEDHLDKSAHSRETSYTDDSSVLSHSPYSVDLDTSTDLYGGNDDYFCKCDSFLDYLEKNIMKQII